MNAKALSLLTLLNVYQKKHLVEILSYHNCDSQTRNAPELDCLIRLQAQNIQQRHIVFLTGKESALKLSTVNTGMCMKGFCGTVLGVSENVEERILEAGIVILYLQVFYTQLFSFFFQFRKEYQDAFQLYR